MPLQRFTVSKGEPITAELFNELLAEVRRLGKLSVAPPLQLSTNGTGIQLSVAGGLNPVMLAAFQEHSSGPGASYPNSSQGCKFFPAVLYPDVRFNPEGSCDEDVPNGSPGSEVFVASFYSLYIPKNSTALVYYANGQWWTNHVRWKVRGVLNEDLEFESSAEMQVWAWNYDLGEDEATEETMIVYDWLLEDGQKVKAEKHVTAFFDVQSLDYYVDGAQCKGTADDEEEPEEEE